MMEARAVIFDCDGTLADTMPPHYEAWLEMLSKYGLKLSEDRFYAMGGWPTRKVAETLIVEAGKDLNPDALADEKELRFEQLLHHVLPIEPVVALVHKHRGRRPIAVASGGMRRIVDQILEHIGLTGMFDAIVCCEDVGRHKPEPDIFLEAARRLNVEPAQCLVYEDTDPGLEAARRAGMDAVDVRTFHQPRRVTPRSVGA